MYTYVCLIEKYISRYIFSSTSRERHQSQRVVYKTEYAFKFE